MVAYTGFFLLKIKNWDIYDRHNHLFPHVFDASFSLYPLKLIKVIR